MVQDFKVEARIGKPQVTYRESVTQVVEHTEQFSKVLAGKEQTAQLTLKVEPLERGSGNRFISMVKVAAGGTPQPHSLPGPIIEAIEHAVQGAFRSGIQYGYPCIDIGVTLVDAVYDPLTATPFAFEAAAAMGFDEACRKAAPELLEPVMDVDIISPKEFVGDAMSQMTQRGGMVLGMDSKSDADIIHAQAPMAKLFGFSTDLRSVTQGRSSFTMKFSHFEIKKGGLGG